MDSNQLAAALNALSTLATSAGKCLVVFPEWREGKFLAATASDQGVDVIFWRTCHSLVRVLIPKDGLARSLIDDTGFRLVDDRAQPLLGMIGDGPHDWPAMTWNSDA